MERSTKSISNSLGTSGIHNEFFLNQLRKNLDRVTIYMTSGSVRECRILAFDPASLLVEECGSCKQLMLMRSAISEIEPFGTVSYVRSVE